MNFQLTFACLALAFCLASANPLTADDLPTSPRPSTTGKPLADNKRRTTGTLGPTSARPTRPTSPTHPAPSTRPTPPTRPTTVPQPTTSGPVEEPKHWALLVAGSSGWWNYRHQADVCHAYQILHAHGIPDERIVVMMVDDIANNEDNPNKGVIINHPNGSDVYHNVPKDYTGDTVTPENFLSVLAGDKEAMKNVGSGKVIESGPNDFVFVNFVDHGATGLLGFPSGELTVKQLNDALKKMNKENRYGKLVLYIEACEAGSMFRNVLPTNINVFATTASDYDESSWGTYCGDESPLGTCLGDEYSVNWMQDSDQENLAKESLQTQYNIVKNVTIKSHVKEYGDLTISKLVVGEFQGNQNAPSISLPDIQDPLRIPSREIPLQLLYRKQAAANNVQQKESVKSEIDRMIEKRSHLETIVKKLVSRISKSHEHEQRLTLARPDVLTNLECHHDLVKAFSQNCFNFGKNPYAMKYAYILANICEDGTLDTENVINTMRQVCKTKTITDGIH